MAYAAKAGRLQRLLDKVALVNEERSKKLEEERQSIIAAYDFEKIRTDNEEIINEVGIDFLTQ